LAPFRTDDERSEMRNVKRSAKFSELSNF